MLLLIDTTNYSKTEININVSTWSFGQYAPKMRAEALQTYLQAKIPTAPHHHFI